MAKQDRILAMDIGSDSLKMAEFSKVGGVVTLEKFAFTEYNISENDGIENLASELMRLYSENNFSSKRVCLSVSGQSAFIRFVKLPPMGNDPEKVRKTVEFEAKQNVPFPMEDVIWDYQLIGSKDEVEMDSVFVVIKKEEIIKITSILEEVGLDVELIEISPTASYNSAIANEMGVEDCSMILNIGSRCSTLTFIDHGKFFVRTIPIGGQTITQQIAKEYNISFLDAEDMKRRHGFVALGGAYEEPDSEVAATVSKIVRNVMTRLHGEINRSINVYRSQQKGRRPVKLFLSGGSSVMAFTPRFFSEKLRMDVEYYNPFKAIRIGEGVDKEKLADIAHMFSDVIGLGIRWSATCPVEISLIPEEVKRQNELKAKVPYFYYSALTLLCCLGIVYGGMSYQSTREEGYIKESSKAIATTEGNATQIRKITKEIDSVKKEYKEINALLSERGQWTRVMNKLESILPENMWLVSVGPLQKEETKVKRRNLRGFMSSRSKTKIRKKKSSESDVVDSIMITGYTSNRRDLDTLDRNLNKLRLKAKKDGSDQVFAGGEDTGDAKTLATEVVKVNDLELYKFKIRLKLSKPLN